MNNLRRGNKELIRELNRMLVLDQIRISGPVSRTDVARETDLGLSTITNIVDELIRENLVFEVGEGSSNGGRKPILLGFNGEYGLVVGIKVEREQVVFGCANLNGEILDKARIHYSIESPRDELLSLITRETEQLLSACLGQRRFCGIGIAVSGLVDRENKCVLYSPILAWEKFDFTPLSDHFGVPVVIDNDANVFALAQLWLGAGAEYNNFIGVTVGVGIGAGIVIDRRLFRGEFGGAGEMGHMVIQHKGTPCYCGQRGCLEVYASDRFILSEAQRQVTLGISTRLREFEELTLQAVYSSAAQGDSLAQDILIQQGENLGIGLKNLVNLFNPAAIILGGEGLVGKEFLLKGIEKELPTNFFAHHRPVDFHLSELGEDVWLIGACSLVVYDLFKAPIYRQSSATVTAASLS